MSFSSRTFAYAIMAVAAVAVSGAAYGPGEAETQRRQALAPASAEPPAPDEAGATDAGCSGAWPYVSLDCGADDELRARSVTRVIAPERRSVFSGHAE